MASKHSTKISWNNCEIRNLHRYKDLPRRMLQIFYGIIYKVHHVILCICQVWINPITLVIIYFFLHWTIYKQADGRTNRQRDLPVTSSTTANATNNSSNINNICSKCKEKKTTTWVAVLISCCRRICCYPSTAGGHVQHFNWHKNG